MGPSSHPGKSNLWTPLRITKPHTYNGGDKGPSYRLDWVDQNHNEVGPTWLAVPVEATRFGSMSDTYLAWMRLHFKSRVPNIIRGGRAITLNEIVLWSVNNGIPMRTLHAAEPNAMPWLKRIKCREAKVAYCPNCVNTPKDLHLGDNVSYQWRIWKQEEE